MRTTSFVGQRTPDSSPVPRSVERGLSPTDSIGTREAASAASGYFFDRWPATRIAPLPGKEARTVLIGRPHPSCAGDGFTSFSDLCLCRHRRHPRRRRRALGERRPSCLRRWRYVTGGCCPTCRPSAPILPVAAAPPVAVAPRIACVRLPVAPVRLRAEPVRLRVVPSLLPAARLRLRGAVLRWIDVAPALSAVAPAPHWLGAAIALGLRWLGAAIVPARHWIAAAIAPARHWIAVAIAPAPRWLAAALAPIPHRPRNKRRNRRPHKPHLQDRAADRDTAPGIRHANRRYCFR